MAESISIRLPEDVRIELVRLARSQGIARSNAIREAIADYLFTNKLRALRARLMPYAEAKGLFTDEDVFRRLGHNSSTRTDRRRTTDETA